MSEEELQKCSLEDLWRVFTLLEDAYEKIDPKCTKYSSEKYWAMRKAYGKDASDETRKKLAILMFCGLQEGWSTRDGKCDFKFEFSSLSELELKLAVFGA